MSQLWCSGGGGEWGQGMVSGESSAETDSDQEQVFFDLSNYRSLVPHYRAAAVSPRANALHDALAKGKECFVLLAAPVNLKPVNVRIK